MDKYVMSFRLTEDGNPLRAFIRANNFAHAKWQLRQAFPTAKYVTGYVENGAAGGEWETGRLSEFITDD
jgi:hypothetical protein